MEARPAGVSGRAPWVRPALGAAIGLGFAFLLARRVEWTEVGRLLTGAEAGPLVLALAALATGLSLRVVRWWWMLRAFDPGLRPASCARPFLVSLALNNTMPLRAGDVARVVGFGRSLRAPAARVLGTLMVERLLDLLVLLLVFFLALLGAARIFPRGFLVAAAAAGAVAAVTLLVLVLAPGLVLHAAEWMVSLARRRRGWGERLAPMVHQLAESLAVLGSPRRSVALLGFSLLAWIAEGVVFAGAAASLGVAFPWPAAWLSLGAATLSTLLPGAPGYVGTFDWFATLGFVAYGTDRSAAAAAALLVHLILWLPVTVTGLALLCLRGRETRSLEVGSA